MITWYFDFISPFAYLAWPRVRALRRAHAIALKPILFAGLLDRLQHKGPAEIPAKREFTYRHVLWRARQAGVPLRFPPTHPFNPIAALRLCIAAGSSPEAVEVLFDWLWAEGRAGHSAEALTEPGRRLGIDDVATAIAAPQVKATLRDNFEAAVADQVIGVPTLAIDRALFWGEDAMDFAEAVLADPTMLSQPPFADIASLPVGIARTASRSSD